MATKVLEPFADGEPVPGDWQPSWAKAQTGRKAAVGKNWRPSWATGKKAAPLPPDWQPSWATFTGPDRKARTVRPEPPEDSALARFLGRR